MKLGIEKILKKINNKTLTDEEVYFFLKYYDVSKPDLFKFLCSFHPQDILIVGYKEDLIKIFSNICLLYDENICMFAFEILYSIDWKSAMNLCDKVEEQPGLNNALTVIQTFNRLHGEN